MQQISYDCASFQHGVMSCSLNDIYASFDDEVVYASDSCVRWWGQVEKKRRQEEAAAKARAAAERVEEQMRLAEAARPAELGGVGPCSRGGTPGPGPRSHAALPVGYPIHANFPPRLVAY